MPAQWISGFRSCNYLHAVNKAESFGGASFFDTEYRDSLNCDLISIGLVSEDGQHEFYQERSDYNRTWSNSFVHAAVLPQLGNAGAALDLVQLAARLAAWFASLPGEVTVASDSFTDWELLLDALDDQRPANLTGFMDLRNVAASPEFNHAVCRFHEDEAPWHHALQDARANRRGWLATQYQYEITRRFV